MRLGGDRGRNSRGRERREADPPGWLLVAGCTALVLVIGGIVAGGTVGAMFVAWGVFAILLLATAFFCLLAIAQGRRGGH